jgi:hypothetical protein
MLLMILGLVFFDTFSLAQSKAEREFAREVSTTRLLAQVRDLVRFGPRTGGTLSGEKSSSYVVRSFKEAGYKPVIQTDPPRLAFSFRGWTLRVVEPKKLRGLINHEWLGPFSPSVPNTKSELVCLSGPEKASVSDVRGKAVLVMSTPERKVYRRLAQYGATCILLISPHLEGAYSDCALISDLEASLKNPIPLFNISWNNGSQLITTLKDSQRVVVAFSAQTSIDSARPRTVIATLEGETEQYYLICAHGDSDSGGPGADDNASGISAVLETARVLKKLVQSHRLPAPRASIRFAVWGTEGFSTENYVSLHAHELKNILGVLNLDEVGTGATRDCLYFESNDVSYNEPLLRALERIGEECVGKKGFWSEATTNPSQGGTDSYVFFPSSLRRLKVPDTKIPSVTIYTASWNELKPIPQTPGWHSKAWHGPADTVYVDYSAYYHSSMDVPELTTGKEPYNMVGAVKAIGLAMLRLAWEHRE